MRCVCSQSSNEETFEEFSEGVIEIYASAGCWVCFVLIVCFCRWVVGETHLRRICQSEDCA